MTIFLNGKPHECTQGIKLAALLDNMNLSERRLAIEINMHIIPRSEYETRVLNDGDKIEIVHAIGGG